MNTFNTPKYLTIFLIIVLSFLLTACGSKGFKSKYSRYSKTKGYAVAKTAQSQIGRYYRYGGSSPKTGFDCSGLIMWAYKKHGITVPRVTSGQAKTGYKVSYKKARPGDIVVFRSSGTSSGYHTAMHVGNNKFVHSPRTGAKVRIESLNSTYWKPRLHSIRRVIK